MSSEPSASQPLSASFGLGQRLTLSAHELRITGAERTRERAIALDDLAKLQLAPSDAHPAKLVLSAVTKDDREHILAEGIKPGKEFQQILLQLHASLPDLQFEPADMLAQLQQAVQNKKAYDRGCLFFTLLFVALLTLLILAVPPLMQLAHTL